MNRKKQDSPRPKKSLGQNFLQDENVAKKIIDSLALTSEDCVIEIGPGYGILTRLILPRVCHYIGVELDDFLANFLQQEFQGQPAFRLIHDDFLKLDLSQIRFESKSIKIVGNIPYHITSPVIFKIVEQRQYFQTLTLMVQREVAQRMVAVPRTKAYGILSILSQTFSVPKILFQVSKHVFFPKPKIESTVVQWDFHNVRNYHITDEASYIGMVKSIFGQRRKILKNTLKQYCSQFPLNELDETYLTSRPEELSVDDLVNLWKTVSTHVNWT